MSVATNNIDQLISLNANAYQANTNYMVQDFAAMQTLLPTAPSITPTAKVPTSWYSLNTFIVSLIALITITLVTIFIVKNSQQSKPTTTQKLLLNTATNNINTDTPVVVTEIPKDPKTAPKRWIYKMPINFGSPTPKALPKKRYIDLSDVKDAEPTSNIKISKAAQKALLNNFVNQLKKPEQTFIIDATKNHTITCNDGTKLYIKANTFVTKQNALVTGNVKLVITECYTYTDIIANGLHTQSNGNLLQTGGMVNINAYQIEQVLQINISNPIQVVMPTTHKKTDMQLFNLVNNNWVANGQWQRNTTNQFSYQNDVIRHSIGGYTIKKYGFKKPFEFLNITINKKKRTIYIPYYSTTNYYDSNIDSIFVNLNNYTFNLRNFGWINCDRFSNMQTTNLEITTTEIESDIQISTLIFPKINSVMNGYSNNNKIYFSAIPRNEKVTLIAFKATNNKVLTCIQSLNTSAASAKAESFIELTPAQVKAKLDALGGVQ